MAILTDLTLSEDSIMSPQGPRPFKRPRQREFNKELALAALKQYEENPLDEDSYVDLRTQQRRDRIWENWQQCSNTFPT
ncbi:hypothetical protein V8C35DRAFT_313815 [Trichoderma chlorosporum]